jgi:hypothetical protein
MTTPPPSSGEPLAAGGFERQMILLDALRSVQDTVRAFDAKAQICGIGFILSVTAVAGLARGLLPQIESGHPALAIVATAFVITVTLFGYVLWPSAMMPHGTVDGVYYVAKGKFGDADELVRAQDRADWRRELAFEILALSDSQTQALTVTQVPAISLENITAMRVSQIASMSTTQLGSSGSKAPLPTTVPPPLV